MKFSNDTHHVETSGLGEEEAFTIDATPEAFEILSSGLYSDRIRAIVRELSCNAYDSHVVAGKADVPFDLQLPNALNPTFVIRDYGTGLSHEQVMSLYRTYFRSTKTNSNDVIGQLGLGSKSPFSYASTFIVESYYQGTKRIYSCYKNEKNFPAVVLMGEEPTDQPNGLSVSIAVRGVDVDKFETAARKTYMYFKTLPNVTGVPYFQPYSVAHHVAGDSWTIRDAYYAAGMSGAYVIQGQVPYPVDATILQENGLTGNALLLAQADVDITLPIGSVSPAPSREHLSYNHTTIISLIDAFNKAAEQFHRQVQAQYDACTTKWEVALLHYKLSSTTASHAKLAQLYNRVHETTPFTHDGKPVSSTLNFDLRFVGDTMLQVVDVKVERKKRRLSVKGSWRPDAVAQEFTFELNAPIYVISVDHPTALKQEIINFLSQKAANAVGIVLRPLTRSTYNPDEMQEIAAKIGGPEIVDSSTFPRVTAARTKRYTSGGKSRETGELLYFTQFPRVDDMWRSEPKLRRKFSRITWCAETVDLEDGGIYVELDRFTPVGRHGANVYHIDDIIRAAKALQLIDADAKVFGMNAKEIKRAHKASDDWVNLFDLIQERWIDTAEESGYAHALLSTELLSLTNIPNPVIMFARNAWSTVRDNVVPGKFHALMDSLADYSNRGKGVQVNAVSTLRSNFHSLPLSLNRHEILENFSTAWSDVMRAYPMLSLSAGIFDASRWSSVVFEYVNAVDIQR